MPGRAVTPLEAYLAEADRIIRVITFWAYPAFLVLMVLITKPFGVLTSLATLCVLLVISEFTVRFSFRDITTTTDYSSYFARRWLKTVPENSWGFREREFDLKKPKGVYRIAVIGDSITYGQGIKMEERFTNLLENRLANQSGKHRFEALNFGRPGAETVDHVEVLINPVVDAEPDFILLQWYINDVEGHDQSGRPSPFRLIPSDFLMSWLHKTSAIFYLLNQQWITFQWKRGWLRSYEEYMIARFGDPNSQESLEAKALLLKFINICKGKGLPLGIVLFSSDNPKLGFLTERVLELCKQAAILCLDLRATFAQYKPDTANQLDAHPGPLANRLVADRLIETFGELWLKRSARSRQTGG